MRYVDGYLLSVPTKNLGEYKKIAQKAGKIWLEYGALQYCECAGEDLNAPWGLPFPKVMKTKEGETAVFAFVVFKSRKHRDQVNKKVMEDERLSKMMDPKKPIFDVKRMVYGGFTTMVDL